MSSLHQISVVSGTRNAKMIADIWTRRESYGVAEVIPKLIRASQRQDNLIMRYEEPSSMVRWDSPLLTVPWTDQNLPSDDIWKAITEGVVKPPNVGTQAVGH
jgi:hypothetical protein